MTPTSDTPSTFHVESFDVPWHRTLLEHDFALIEPIRVEASARADLGGWPVVPKGREESADNCPLLVELRILSNEERIALLERITAWPATRGVPYFSALIDCPDAVETLQHHLANRSSVRHSDGHTVWLRYHDPRVFPYLSWMLHPDQLGTLLASIRRWTWPGADGRWHSLIHEGASAGKRAGGLRIDADQWPDIGRAASITAVRVALTRTAPELQQDAALAQAVNQRLVEAARTFPHATTDGRRLYAEHAVRFGDGLFRHPDMQHQLAPVFAGQQDYLPACADLDDATLRAWATSSELAKDRP